MSCPSQCAVRDRGWKSVHLPLPQEDVCLAPHVVLGPVGGSLGCIHGRFSANSSATSQCGTFGVCASTRAACPVVRQVRTDGNDRLPVMTDPGCGRQAGRSQHSTRIVLTSCTQTVRLREGQAGIARYAGGRAAFRSAILLQ
jgi:hypothetical protein